MPRKTDPPADPEQLLTAYRNLTEPALTLLRLLAVNVGPLYRPPLADCLGRLNIKDAKDNYYTPSHLKPVTDQLIRDGLVTQEQKGLYCNPALREPLARQLLAEGRFEILAQTLEKVDPYRSGWGFSYFRNREQALREIRIALYRGDMAALANHLGGYLQEFPQDFRREHPLEVLCYQPFDPDWFGYLPDESAYQVLVQIGYQAFFRLEPLAGPLAYLEERCGQDDAPDYLHALWVEYTFHGATLEQARARWRDDDSPQAAALAGRMALLEGRTGEARACFKTALERLRKAEGRQARLNELNGLFYLLALIEEDTPTALDRAWRYADQQPLDGSRFYATVYRHLLSFLHLRRSGHGDLAGLKSQLHDHKAPPTLQDLFLGLLLYWSEGATATRLAAPRLQRLLRRAEETGYPWVADQTAALLVRLDHSPTRPLPQRPLVDRVQPKASWELALTALTARQPEAADQADTRLAWWLILVGDDQLAIDPREQKRNAQGGWTKGRAVSLKRLWTRDITTPLSVQDRRVLEALRFEPQYYYSNRGDYFFDPEQALPALVGHPLLFWADDPTVQVELVKGEPELRVVRGNDGLRLELWPQTDGRQTQVIVRETPTRLRLIPVGKEHQRMQAILGQEGLVVPPEAEERVRETVGALAGRVTVHSDVGGSGALQAEEVPADPRPHLHLYPYGEGLKAQLRVVPFAPVAPAQDPGPAFTPGGGGATVIARVGDKRLQARRDLERERQRAGAVVAACPALNIWREGDWDWTLNEPQDCLELLLQARELEDVVVAWPEGEKFKVSRPVDLDSLSLAVRRDRNWFEVDGTLALEDGRVLEMRRLLELLQNSAGRFLPLGDDQFLTLTDRFRRQLEELQSFGEGQGRFHPLTAPMLDDLAGEVGQFKADKAWRQQRDRLKEARELQPALPSTFKGELRDYQRAGFDWLSRLAYWGVGACLADDMGLGKTVQALAVILNRAPEGPTLVVAPTSVGANWQEEAVRFAPTLQVTLYAEADRQRTLEQAGPFDLVIVSYTLLQQDAEALAQVKWQTVVLDEAQAIKNPTTKRSQAAMGLEGAFRVITTGTPVENHLGELWNLFRFINPGLLGSRERFVDRFAGPIERHNDPLARERLKKLIQPFILRRTKQQVLQELPGRTDIVLHVELDQQELAFYEALRLQALEQLEGLDDAPAGQKHLKILAQITRLRRACCHPELVTPGVEVGSSKLNLFSKVMEELLDNDHKVLVFSQFVDHLTLIRRRLEERGVSYQYLDGATPAAERRKRVKAFQSGQGEVFLISLKAGGTGLNLTAADYVIHMDPWWNPAVEDQASDRAHRIGQQRPVTVYRLVTRHTIEEKIVALHHQKRDLAEGLLEGADMSGRVGAEELMRLIREG